MNPTKISNKIKQKQNEINVKKKPKHDQPN